MTIMTGKHVQEQYERVCDFVT